MVQCNKEPGGPEAGSESTTRNADEYNFRRFRLEWPVQERKARPGNKAPDGTIYTLDGDSISLSSLWEDGPAVIEFGSITCPVFQGKIETMDELARHYGDDVTFAVVYSREAHPGVNYPPPDDRAEKLERARCVRDENSVEREIYVDDIDGSVHRLFDALPNSVHLIGRDGTVAYRADWTNPDGLTKYIDDLLAANGAGADVEHVNIENNFENASADKVVDGFRVLWRAGWDSVVDFIRAMPKLARIHREEE